MATKKNTRYAEAVWIEKRKRWQVKVQINGQRKMFLSTIPGRKGKADAERKADQWNPALAAASIKEGDTASPASSISASVRFWQAYELFLKDNKKRTSEANYANNESLGRNWLKPRLEHKLLSSITEQDWQNCINDAIEKKRAKKTLKNIRGAISAFNRFCKKNRVYMAPTEDLDIPKNAPVKPKVILQPEQLRILFGNNLTLEDNIEQPAFFIHAWRFCVLTGLRRGELLGLQRSDIKSGTIHIQRSINNFNHIGPTKTAKANRIFRLNKHMKETLEAQFAMLKHHKIVTPWIFPGEDGNHAVPATFYDRWCLYREYHGFKVTLHELRHTLISIGGTALTAEQLKPMVGHTDKMDTFGVYGHEIDGEQQRVADALDALFDLHLKEEQVKKE